MENKTITMPLIEYQNWEIDNEASLKEIKVLRKEIEELQNAKAVFIERIVTYDRMGYSRTDTLRPRIYGKGVELNKAIQELCNEVDKIYIAYNEREAKMGEHYNKSIQKYVEQSAILERELESIQSKWWYKLFN
jgi:hypothetical protein